MAMQVVCISTKWGGLGRCRVGRFFYFLFFFLLFFLSFLFQIALEKNRENVWKLQLMAVNQILSNIYGILMLWRKQSGTFSVSFKVKFLGSWINFFSLFLDYFFLVLLLLLMLSQRRAANSLALIAPNSFAFLVWLHPPLFPGKLGKVSVQVLSHPRRFLLVQKETGIQTCRNIPILMGFKWEEKAGGGVCSCVLCAVHPCSHCAAVTFCGTIFESRNVNHWIWNPCEWSPFLNQTRDFFFFYVQQKLPVLLY